MMKGREDSQKEGERPQNKVTRVREKLTNADSTSNSSQFQIHIRAAIQECTASSVVCFLLVGLSFK